MMMACFARPFRHAMGEEGECRGAGVERSESGKWGVAYRPHRVNECASRCVRFNSFRDYLLPVSPSLYHPIYRTPSLPLPHHTLSKWAGVSRAAFAAGKTFWACEKLTENFTSHRSLANQQKKTNFLHRYNNHAYIFLTQLSFSVCVGVCVCFPRFAA